MSNSNRILPVLLPAAGVMALAFVVALSAACRGADQIPPDGSTITLAANPATVVLVGGSGTSDVVATVSSAVGLPLKDQDVRFSSSAGSLFTPPPDNEPAANIPIRTDDLGNAHVILVTTTSTTVTARSGKATGTLTLTTVPGNLNNISLSPVFGVVGCLPDANFTNCDDQLCLEAQATDTDGNGVSGIQLVFQLTNIVTDDPTKLFNGIFSPRSTITTDAGGFAKASFSIGSSTCSNVCGGFATCTGDIVVSLQGGGFQSNPVSFTSAIQ